MPEKTNLVGVPYDALSTLISHLGEPAYRTRQIFSGIYHRRLTSWDEFTDLSRSLRRRLNDHYLLAHPALAQLFSSQDATRRYLFSLADGNYIESVFIPEEHRDTVCISTQVGCAIGCRFCLTGTLQNRRNLSTSEIIGQLLFLQRDRGVSSKRLNLVFMGMGEPLNNYENVMSSFHLMLDKRGVSLSPRRVTLSTSGIVPFIERLATEPILPNLAVSLNATTDPIRTRLIPINKKWNLSTLLETCRHFPITNRQHITFEYVLIADVNDTPADAARLVQLLKGINSMVNLIPLNPDPAIPFQPPSTESVSQFHDILLASNISAHIRKPRGADISAACGMLAARPN